MKKLYLFLSIFIGLSILSCSSDDNSDYNNDDTIIGKWRAIEKYESNISVELSTCEPHIYTEYKIDNTVTGDKIISQDFPSECNSIIFDIQLWENLGNNNYRIYQPNEQDNIYKLYINGTNLVEEHPNGITKTVYEPH